MKLKSWTAGIAALTLAAAPAFAGDSLAQWSYDQMVQPAGCCDSGCDGGCDGGYDCGDGCDCGSACGGGGLMSDTCLGGLEGFSLADTLGVCAFDVGGWTQFGIHDSQTPGSTAFNDLGAFNDRAKELNLHQQYFYLGKEADGSCGAGFGFRADFVYGTDAQKTQAFGNPAGSWDEGWDNGAYGWAIPQLYAEVASGDFSVKIGKFYTLVGYEVVTAPDNFFYSHALTMYNSEPFTHTGVLTTYTGFENITLYNGWTAGWDSGFDSVNSGNNYLGGFSVGLGDNVTMTYINTYGNFGAISQGDDDDYSHSIVFDVAVRCDINYVFQTDYKRVAGGPDTDEDISINQYLFYTYNDHVKLGTRVEWWRDNGESNYELTTGVNIQLLDNLVLRPEARKDWNPAAGTDEDMVAIDAILVY